MKSRATAWTVAFTFVAAQATPQAVTIDHQGIGCLVADHYPEINACFQPSREVARARVQFRAVGTIPWYYVEMQPGGACHTGVLPKPQSSIKGIEYYIDVASKGFGENRTADYSPRVASGLGGCKRRGIVAAFATTASVTVFAPSGAPAVPAGFSAAGVTTTAGVTTGPTGGASAQSQGGQGGGGEADKAKVKSGGGGGGGALVALAVVAAGAAGAGAYVASQKDKEEEKTPDPRPTPGGPGIGDISFRLSWTGSADLDLHVQEPNGNVISFQSPTSSTGGRLDVDSNVNCITSNVPVENVFWPTGQAPRGTYQYWVRYFLQCGDATSKAFTLQVRRGATVVETQTGTVAPNQESRRFGYQY